tara:strand:+ start:655 stop:762 length:108 start_codon:yes stop_codon:yes gene_type:complete
MNMLKTILGVLSICAGATVLASDWKAIASTEDVNA